MSYPVTHFLSIQRLLAIPGILTILPPVITAILAIVFRLVGRSLAQNCMYSHDIESINIDDSLNTQAGTACSPGGHMALRFPR